MPLEDLIGNKYIDSLNEAWPLGSDNKDAGDNHLRGIKNVLKRSFPKFTGPLTLSQKDLLYGTLPEGTRLFFYMSAPPVGWKRVTGVADSRMLRVVPTATAGGTQGGVHDPILCDKVAPHTHDIKDVQTNPDVENHTHAFSGSTGTESAQHKHTGTTDSEANTKASYGISYASGGNPAFYVSDAHTHTFTTEVENAAHTHSFSGTTGNPAARHRHPLDTVTKPNSGTAASPWQPRYFDVILCERENPTT
jgi:hypothetical protein